MANGSLLRRCLDAVAPMARFHWTSKDAVDPRELEERLREVASLEGWTVVERNGEVARLRVAGSRFATLGSLVTAVRGEPNPKPYSWLRLDVRLFRDAEGRVEVRIAERVILGTAREIAGIELAMSERVQPLLELLTT